MTNDVNVGLLSRLGSMLQNASRPARDAQGEGVQRSGAGAEPPKALAEEPRAGPAAQAEGPEQVSLSEEELNGALNELNDLAQNIRRELKFSADEASGRVIIEVYDSTTDELIRQIPPEQVLSVLRHLKEFDSGLLQEQA